MIASHSQLVPPPDARVRRALHAGGKEEKTQSRDDPRADIEAELERLKRYQRTNHQQTRRQTAETDVHDELERLKRKYRP